MCNRYYRTSEEEELVGVFHAKRVTAGLIFTAPAYNAAPRSTQPIVRLDEESGERELAPAQWGLIPHWARDPKSFKLTTFNARMDRLMASSVWRDSFSKRRCLVPANGFLEFEHAGKEKLPWAFTVTDQALFAFAGLWDRSHGEDGRDIDTFTIVTSEPNKLVAPYHDRAPVILKPRDYDLWFSPAKASQALMDILCVYPAAAMRCRRVAKAINNVANNRSDLFDPIDAVD